MRCILTVNYSPWSSYSGGGQRSTHNLACALSRRGHRVTVIFTKRPWESVPLPSDLPYDVVWAAMPIARRGTPFFVAREVHRLLRDAPEPTPTIVHSNGEEAALIPQLKQRVSSSQRFGFVMTPRYPNLPDPLQRAASQQSAIRLALLAVVQTKYIWLGRALRGADWICPTSRSAAEMVQRAYGLARERISVVPNGISEEFLRATSDAPEVTNADPTLAAFTSAGAFAIYFGRLAREKGVHTLIDALTLTDGEAEGPDVRVLFAGRGPELSRLQQRVAELHLGDRVHFSTWLDAPQLATLVRAASFAVLPSLEESFGNTMAEAMALSVPVLSTSAGSIPELIDNGRNGVLVTPGDARALANAMRALAVDPTRRQQLGAAGRAHVVEHLTWDASAARFEQIYERVLAG